jgi:RNA-directed DNA polymerase
VVQQAIAQVLTPIFEPGFSESSFGFRPGRNAHQAIRQVQAFVTAGRRIAVDLDLAKFFDTVDHDVLMGLLGRTLADKRLLTLIGRYLRAGVLVGEYIEPSDIGTPQGGPMSPLLANILLHQLDRELEKRGHRFARYADDLVILVKSPRAGERVMRSITRYLETTLKLKVNPAKSKVAPMSECSFLGFTMRGTKIRWADKALANFKHRVRELTGRSWGVSMAHRLHKLGQYVRGWTAYYGISQYYRPVPELDDWIRAAHAHVLLEAVALGAHEDQAPAGFGREPEDGDPAWREQQELLAHGENPGAAAGDVQRVVESARLVSVKDLWCKAQGYTT